MKAKRLSFVFFYFHLFFRIGTFQRFTAEKKENPEPSQIARKTSQSPSSSVSPRPARVGSDNENMDNEYF